MSACPAGGDNEFHEELESDGKCPGACSTPETRRPLDLFFGQSLPVNIDQDANRHGAEGEVGAAIAYKRQRKTLVWKQSGIHADVNGSLQSNHHHEPESEQHPEAVPRIHRNQDSAHDNEDVTEDNDEGASKPEFLTNDRENEVC